MRLETARLVLRSWTVEDAPALRAAIAESAPHLARWFAWARSGPPTWEQAQALCERYRELFDEGAEWHWGAFARDGAVAGGVSLRPDGTGAAEIGYWLHVARQGQGLATEMVRAVVAQAPRMGLDRIEALVQPDNARSLAVLAQVGFVETRVRVRRDGEDLVVWINAA